MDQIAQRRRAWGEAPDPVADHQRPGAVDDGVEPLFQELGMVVLQRPVEGPRDVVQAHAVFQGEIAGQIDFHHRVPAERRAQVLGERAVDGSDGGGSGVLAFGTVAMNQDDRFHPLAPPRLLW